MYIFFGESTPKTGIQLSHDIETIEVRDNSLMFHYRKHVVHSVTANVGIAGGSGPAYQQLPAVIIKFKDADAAQENFDTLAFEMQEYAKGQNDQFLNLFINPSQEEED